MSVKTKKAWFGLHNAISVTKTHVFTNVETCVMHVMRALLSRSLTKLEQKYDQLYKKVTINKTAPCV